MPTYNTLPESADLMQSKSHGFKIIEISDDIDVGYWWNKCGGSASGKLKATLVKPDATTVTKLSENGDISIVNSSPQRVKVLIAPTDIDFVGNLKIFVEFKIDDSWFQADKVTLGVVDDPVPTP